MASPDAQTPASEPVNVVVKRDEYTYVGQTKQDLPKVLGVDVPDLPKVLGVDVPTIGSETLHGRGACIWTTGDTYEGEYRDGDKHGHGVYTWPNGRRYEGAWRDDGMSGRGAMWLPDGRVFDGVWAGGRPLQGTALEPGGALLRARYDGKTHLTADNWGRAERRPLGRLVAGGPPPPGGGAAGAPAPWTGTVEAEGGAVYTGWLSGLRPCGTGVLSEGGARFRVEYDGAATLAEGDAPGRLPEPMRKEPLLSPPTDLYASAGSDAPTRRSITVTKSGHVSSTVTKSGHVSVAPLAAPPPSTQPAGPSAAAAAAAAAATTTAATTAPATAAAAADRAEGAGVYADVISC